MTDNKEITTEGKTKSFDDEFYKEFNKYRADYVDIQDRSSWINGRLEYVLEVQDSLAIVLMHLSSTREILIEDIARLPMITTLKKDGDRDKLLGEIVKKALEFTELTNQNDYENKYWELLEERKKELTRELKAVQEEGEELGKKQEALVEKYKGSNNDEKN